LAAGAEFDVIWKQSFVCRVGAALNDDVTRLQQQPADDAVVAASAERSGEPDNRENE
jgi:hypothetical protein